MPSEDRSAEVLQVLGPATQAFHSAVVAAVDELRTYIAAHRPHADTVEAARAMLGSFGMGRIDGEAFSALFGTNGQLTPEELARLDQALEVLRDFATRGDDLYRIRVQPGVDLRDSVRGALAARGRVFAVARGVEMIRTGRGLSEPDDDAGGFPFRHWNRAERQIAPPLVIEVEGGDLLVSGLAEYLEGRMKIVLLVNAPSPEAPLARLIAPNVFVQQTSDASKLGAFAAFDGPAIAAVVPAASAQFTYDPSAGARFEQRLKVESPATGEARHAIGAVSAAAQSADAEWLRQLNDVSSRMVEQAPSPAAAEPVTPADTLAAWLLRQTDLTGA